MRGFLSSGWTAPLEPAEELSAPATKWHMYVNKQGGLLVHLNVHVDNKKQRSFITHEAAASAGQARHMF
jgi:hypothetical protein